MTDPLHDDAKLLRQQRLETTKTGLQTRLGLDFPRAWRVAQTLFEEKLPEWEKGEGIPSPYKRGEPDGIRQRLQAEFPQLANVQTWMQCAQLYRALERLKRGHTD